MDKFSSSTEVLNECQNMLISQQKVMRNRALIQRLANGEAPFTDEERRAENIKTNANFLELTRIASNASNQLNNAFFKPAQFFQVTIDKGPIHKRSLWGASITKAINRELKKSRTYKYARESAHAQVVLHGPGPLIWKNRRSPCPSSAGIDDIIVPAGTENSMDNLDRFGIYTELTWSQLYDVACGKVVDPGWNKGYVKAILTTLYSKGVQPINQGNRWMFPEKIQEDIKEGSAFFASSSLPRLLAWNFFYRDDENGKWCRKMVVDFASVSGASTDAARFQNSNVEKSEDFLYESEDYADDWQEVIHWYIGNCSNYAPYRYYSTRSIGYLLYGVCAIQNKLRCRTMDHVFQSLLMLFRNISDDHREKLGMIDLNNFGVIPDGLSMVNANERHEVDWNLVVGQFNQNRQLMAESSQSFVPDMPGIGGKEMTATETLVRQNTSTNLTSAVLNQLADQSAFEYREISRRFCIKSNPDEMAVRFREAIQKEGVPLDMLDVEAWDIIPEMTVGGGNKAVELSVTQALMQEILPLADPDGQRIITRRRYLALTDNPDEAMEVIPEAPAPPSNDAQYAQQAFPVLMIGLPFIIQEGTNRVAYAGMLLNLLQIKYQQTAAIIGQPSGVPIAAEAIAGMFNVVQHVGEQIQMIARDDRRKEVAKQMMKMLKELMGTLQDLAKQVSEMAQQQSAQQGGVSPETQQKLAEKMMLAQADAQAKVTKSQQSGELKQIAFLEENARRNAMTEADAQRKLMMTQADITALNAKTIAEIMRPKPETTNKNE